MGAHAKAVRNRFKVFLLLVNAVAAAPPPRLMHKRPMRRVHQPDDSVIDTYRHIRSEVSEFVFFFLRHSSRHPELLDLRRGIWGLLRLGKSRARRPGVRYVDPHKTVLLFARITASVD